MQLLLPTLLLDRVVSISSIREGPFVKAYGVLDKNRVVHTSPVDTVYVYVLAQRRWAVQPSTYSLRITYTVASNIIVVHRDNTGRLKKCFCTRYMIISQNSPPIYMTRVILPLSLVRIPAARIHCRIIGDWSSE